MLFKNKRYFYIVMLSQLIVWGVSLWASEVCQLALATKPTGLTQMPLQAGLIYVEGSVRANNVIFLKRNEYIDMVKQDSIPTDAVIVLDEIPLEVDLPLVSAIIVGKELSLGGTHIQMLAEKLGIPFIVSSSFVSSNEARRFVEEFKGFELYCETGNCTITGAPTRFATVAKVESVLPLYANRYERDLLNVNNLLELTSREIVGDKYYSLMEFKKRFPDLVPDIAVLTSGFYERFLDYYVANGELLRLTQSHLERKLERANKSQDEDSIKSALEEMKNAILNSRPYRSDKDVFSEATQKVINYYGKRAKHKFSIRSNNDVEDLLATGLYKSTAVKEVSSETLSTALRQVWSSLYDYRAYSIRRYWGQKESNLSMPILLHPFLDDIYSHAVGSFYWTEQKGLELEVNMVLGESEKATNPSANAIQYRFKISNNLQNKNRPDVSVIQSKIEVVPELSESSLPKYVTKPILKFFKEVQGYVVNEFRHRNFRPTQINIEFVIEKPKYFWNSPKIKVLQYKPALGKEVMYSLLTGRLTRDETDRRDLKYVNNDSLTEILRQNQLKPFGTLIPEKLWAFYYNTQPRHKRQLRYVLALDNKTPRFFVWDSGVYHGDMKMNFWRTSLQWMKSGYITFKISNDRPTLTFTETTINDETDRALLLSISNELFNLAFTNALAENPQLAEMIGTIRPQIIFHTFEGSGEISLPDKIDPINAVSP